MPGVEAPIQRAPAAATACFALTASWIGMPSVMVTIVRMPAAMASRIAGSTASRGTMATLATAPVPATASAQVR